MIRYLAIRNLAVVESVAIEFERSFNVLTGETGAGKSILVGAVGLLLGGRASQDLVRTGEPLATIEALFEDNGGELVLRREITATGRSRAFVNGELTTAAALKELASRLVELHGQHEHQQLLDPQGHLSVLDVWAALELTAKDVADAFARVQEGRQQVDRLRMDRRERAARLELVAFQLDELNKAAVKPGEDVELSTERQVLRSAETILRLCAESYGELYEADDAVLTRLARIWKRVGELAAIDGRFAPQLAQRETITASLQDLAFALRDFAESIDASPGRLEQVEERLALIERVKRKHGPTLEDAIAKRDRLAAEYGALTAGPSSVASAEAELRRASAAFLESANRLSRDRHAAAPRFARALEGELAELAMQATRFEVRLTSSAEESAWSASGIDVGEFYLSPNPGEELRPLARIVSGGELSRVMLALKTLAAAGTPGKTLIFDEVDAGIGGRVASVVGDKLRGLGERFQVLCITHLPQIAAAAATHFSIEKSVRASRTATSVQRLDESGRIEELARLIGGAATGQAARATARDLIAKAAAVGKPSRVTPRE